MAETLVGKIGITPRANNLSSYEILDLIAVDGRSYLSLVDNNTAAVTDDTKWLKITDSPYDVAKKLGYIGTEAEWIVSLSAASEQAAGASITAAALANEKAGLANQAASDATTAAALATQKAQDADAATQATILATTNVNQSKSNADSATASANAATSAALNAYNLVATSAVQNSLENVPANIVVDYPALCPIGSNPVIKVKIFPEKANKSCVFMAYSGDAKVKPNGEISFSTPGDIVLYAVSSINSAIYKEITIQARATVARTTESGAARTAEDGTAIEC